jgi:hypothetical protein
MGRSVLLPLPLGEGWGEGDYLDNFIIPKQAVTLLHFYFAALKLACDHSFVTPQKKAKRRDARPLGTLKWRT